MSATASARHTGYTSSIAEICTKGPQDLVDKMLWTICGCSRQRTVVSEDELNKKMAVLDRKWHYWKVLPWSIEAEWEARGRKLGILLLDYEKLT